MSNSLQKTVAGIKYNARQAEAYAPKPHNAPLNPPVMPLNPQPKLFSFSMLPGMGQNPAAGVGGRRSYRKKRTVRRHKRTVRRHKRKTHQKRK